MKTKQPNFVDDTPIKSLAVRCASMVQNQTLKNWLRQKIPDFLKTRMDCAINITFSEPNLPPWARLRLNSGEDVHRFHISQAAYDDIQSCVAYLRSLELYSGSVNLTIKGEATKRLKKLSNQSLNQAANAKAVWDDFLSNQNPLQNLRLTDIQPAQDDGGVIRVESQNDRHWERLQTFSQFRDTGTQLQNCLQKFWGIYDQAFRDGTYHFWRLVNTRNRTLALMRLDPGLRKAVEFKARNNKLATNYAEDAERLLLELGYEALEESNDFSKIGIHPLGFNLFNDAEEPHLTINGVKIWLCAGWFKLKTKKRTLHIDLDRGSSLESVWRDGPPKKRVMEWFGRILAKVYTDLPDPSYPILDDLVDTGSEWKYWKDASEIRKFAGFTFYKSEKGLAILPVGDLSPLWVLRGCNVNAGRPGRPLNVFRIDLIRTEAEEALRAVENSKDPLTFWRWVDRTFTKGPSYHELATLINSPRVTHLQPTGWVQADGGWTSLVVANPIKPYEVKERWVFDELGCEKLKVNNTQLQRTYAKQLAVFRSQELVLSALITSRQSQRNSKVRSFKILADDYSWPDATALFFTAIRNEMATTYEKEQVERFVTRNEQIDRTIRLHKNTKPFAFRPVIDFNQHKSTVYPHRHGDETSVFGIDGAGRVLWTAILIGSCYMEPIVYVKGAESAAMAYVCSPQNFYRISDDWSHICRSAGYIYLADKESARKILSPHLNQLSYSDWDKNKTTAVRAIDSDDFTWTISDNEDLEQNGEVSTAIWKLTLLPGSNDKLQILRQEDDLNHSNQAIQRVSKLVHAILDSTGKTMSAIQLDILGLERSANGGHTSNNGIQKGLLQTRLSQISSRSGMNLEWKLCGLRWLLKENGTRVVAVFNSESRAKIPLIFMKMNEITVGSLIAINFFKQIVDKAESMKFVPKVMIQAEAEKMFKDIHFNTVLSGNDEGDKYDLDAYLEENP